MTHNKADKLSIGEKVGYSLGDMAGNFVYQSALLFLGYFYTTVYGLDAAKVAMIFLVVRIFDAVNDPLIGFFVDRTHTRWGQCRPWILFACVPYAVCSVLVFTVPDMSGMAKEIYAYVTYAVLMLLFTMTNIPYGALTAKMTADPKERENLNSMRFMFATGGGLIITTCVPVLARTLSDDKATGYQYAMTVMAVIAVVMFVITFLTTKERVVETEAELAMKPNMKDALAILMKNREFLILIVVTFIMVSSQAAKGTLQLFYINDYVVNPAANKEVWFLSMWMVGGMIGAKLTQYLLKFADKKRAWIGLQIISAVVSLAALALGNQNLLLIVALNFFMGFFNQMIAPIWFTYCADTQDYSEVKFGKRQDGLALSFMIFALKMGLSVGGAAALWALSFYGYESGEGVEQSAEAVQGVLTTFAVVPAVGFILTALLILPFRLNSKTIEEHSLALEKMREEES